MNDTILTIVAETAVEILFPLVLLVLITLGGWVLQRLGTLIGEKQTATLRNTLAPAIERAIAKAEADGLTGATLKAEATAYLHRTMQGTLSKLGASEADLRERIDAEMAQRKPKI